MVPNAGYSRPSTRAIVTGPRKPTTTTQFGTLGRSINHKIAPMIATNSTIAKTMTINLSLIDVGLKSQSISHSLSHTERHSGGGPTRTEQHSFLPKGPPLLWRSV